MPDPRQRHGDPDGSKGEDVQSLFHDQARRRGDRPRPVDEPRHRGETTWRQDRRRYQARRIYRIHYYASAHGGGTGTGWRQKLSVYILVVDDEPDVEALFRQQFRRDIKSGRFLMEFASSAPAALVRAAEIRDPTLILILSDINMPGMGGLELLPKVREERHNKPAIMITAYGDMETSRNAMNRGAIDFLTKPIDFGDLEMTIDKTIRHVEMMRDARRRQAEAERAHASLSRYFSPQIASRLAAIGDSDGMEVHWREVAVIFTDITGFTSLVETAAAEVLGALLNEYVGGMTDVVFAHEGTVAKIIGDAIQILFNAPGEQSDYARRAIACAHDLDVWAQAFRERWKAKGVNFGGTRIGVHAGPALVGNFGGSRFFDYTAYGDTINTAARLEAANKALGTRICVSGVVADGAGDFRGRPVG